MRPAIRAVRFPGPFLPQQIVSIGGQVWVIGTTSGRCTFERIDPVTLRSRTFTVPECGPYVAAGAGHLYVTAVHHTSGTNDAALHLESFDTATGRVTVAAPVMFTAVGSGLAHMALAYGAGSLWLYPWGDRLLRVTPLTGAVVASASGLTSGGGHPVMVTDDATVWMAEGPGGPGLFRLAAADRTASRVYSVPAPGSLLWVVAAGGRIWADAASYTDGGRSVVTRLVAFDRTGRMVLQSPPEALGDSAVAGTHRDLWTVGVGASCSGPQRLWQVDEASGRSTVVATLRSPIEACLTEGANQLAVAGGYVFVLDATGTGSPASVLYRLTGG